MDEIYVLVLAPSKKTGKCQMENFKGESPLIFWIKSACLFYCYNKYNLKKRRPPYEPLEQGTPNDGREIGGDRFNPPGGSIDFDLSEMNRSDVEILLSMMPNLRYRKIIRLLHLEQKTYKETAEALGMSMDNFYNKRILAEEQFKRIQKKEGGYE